MPGPGADISFTIRLQPKRFWLMVSVDVADRISLDLVLDTGSPLSGLSARSWDALISRGLLQTSGSRVGTLRQLSIEGQAIPDLAVRISPRATEFDADGILGVNFFGQFRAIHFDVPSMQLTLTSP